jgi:transposase-like protein
MLAIQDSLRPVGTAIAARPACPNCGRSMHLARIAPRTNGLSDLQIYRCGECGVSLTKAAGDGAAAYPG